MKNNKPHFFPDSLQSFVSIKVTWKFEKPGGQENNLIGKRKPMDSSDSQRHRAAEQLTARCQLSLELSFLEAEPQGS